ncbi:hypothetical protein WME90_28670 [Sorangium sp. So ce375]|uniref:hypothetical protein n=1 Tax=Sorangium sp. So ce375 TaxID=3133306 RepID=UPI003F5B68BB
MRLKPEAVERLPGEMKLKPEAVERLPGEVRLKPEAVERLPGEMKLKPEGVERLPGEVRLKPEAVERLPGDVPLHPGGARWGIGGPRGGLSPLVPPARSPARDGRTSAPLRGGFARAALALFPRGSAPNPRVRVAAALVPRVRNPGGTIPRGRTVAIRCFAPNFREA